ncbi:C6 finger domain protein [Colletotrichum chrysophilum]|uniref:C6 finger domain protein n=1 Tax=Colletotrichum chrysophilum TaxID=1836956 RepID=A0AAD9EMZ6_9PEZI|nr:C6 finger domain protein [Colletotrichum chrysophilum]
MSSSEGTVKHRRPHKKSRLGCRECKRRKIKCDEARPSCLNCVRREVDCSFRLERYEGDGASKCMNCRFGTDVLSQTNTTRTTGPGLSNSIQTDGISSTLLSVLAEQSKQLEIISQRLAMMENSMARSAQHAFSHPVLSYADMELLHHYHTITASTLAHDDKGKRFWLVRLPELAFQYPHLLHLMLAFAALHKVRLHPLQQDLLAQAERHHVLGIQGSTMLLQDINDSNYEVVHTSAILIGLINLALGPRPGEYIAFSDQAGSDFLGLLRGVQSIRFHNDVDESTNAPSEAATNVSISRESPEYGGDTGYRSHFQMLRRRAQQISDIGVRAAYNIALDDLEVFFVVMEPSTLENEMMSALPDAAHHASPLGWLYRIPERFLDQLRTRESLSLAILACFTVVLKELEHGWPADGWADHIMAGVCERTEPAAQDLLQWPVARLGDSLP